MALCAFVCQRREAAGRRVAILKIKITVEDVLRYGICERSSACFTELYTDRKLLGYPRYFNCRLPDLPYYHCRSKDEFRQRYQGHYTYIGIYVAVQFTQSQSYKLSSRADDETRYSCAYYPFPAGTAAFS